MGLEVHKISFPTKKSSPSSESGCGSYRHHGVIDCAGRSIKLTTPEGARIRFASDRKLKRRHAYVALNLWSYKNGMSSDDDIHDRLGIASIEEKQRLRWLGHVRRGPLGALVHSGILSHDNNARGRRRTKLAWEEATERDLKEWDITKDLDFF